MSKKISVDLTPIALAVTGVLVVLKLTNVIDWSWWAVTAPIWFPIAITFAFGAMILILVGVAFLVAALMGKLA